jgi:hypothetical protein
VETNDPARRERPGNDQATTVSIAQVSTEVGDKNGTPETSVTIRRVLLAGGQVDG